MNQEAWSRTNVFLSNRSTYHAAVKGKGLVLVDPRLVLLGPGLDLVGTEPESNLLLGVLDGVASVADVSADGDGKVTSDGAWSGSEWVSSA